MATARQPKTKKPKYIPSSSGGTYTSGGPDRKSHRMVARIAKRASERVKGRITREYLPSHRFEEVNEV
jgi:hypothetical protein